MRVHNRHTYYVPSGHSTLRPRPVVHDTTARSASWPSHEAANTALDVHEICLPVLQAQRFARIAGITSRRCDREAWLSEMAGYTFRNVLELQK